MVVQVSGSSLLPKYVSRAPELALFAEHAKQVHADFTLSVRTEDEFTAVLAAIGGHNDYNPRMAAKLLGVFIPQMMGVRIEHFVGGPALYFSLPFWDMQTIDQANNTAPERPKHRKYEIEERQAMANAIRTTAAALKADEIMVYQMVSVGAEREVHWHDAGPAPREVRVWWD